MITRGLGTARDLGGMTGNDIVSGGFLTVRVTGLREVATKLQILGTKMGEPAVLEDVVRSAGELIRRSYRSKIHSVTGNLKKSVRIQTKTYSSAVVAIIGPWQSGRAKSREGQESGNIAWIYEFGTGPRKPGSQKRRAYINVHQSINRRMRWHSSANDEQFANTGRGYYFLMGSINVTGRESGAGAFVKKPGGGTRPYFLAANETYPAMPRSDAMQKTVAEQQGPVMSAITASIANTLARLTK